MEHYQAKVCHYAPMPKTEVDNDKLRLVISSYHVKTEFNICAIVSSKE